MTQDFSSLRTTEDIINALSTLYFNLNEIERVYSLNDIVADTLIQINIGREPQKYGILEENLKQDKIYNKDEEQIWICTSCGHKHKGKSAPLLCPVCRYDKAYFKILCEHY